MLQTVNLLISSFYGAIIFSYAQGSFSGAFVVIAINSFSFLLCLSGILTFTLYRRQQAGFTTKKPLLKRKAWSPGFPLSLPSLFSLILAFITLFIVWFETPFASVRSVQPIPTAGPSSMSVLSNKDVILPDTLTVGSYTHLPPQTFVNADKQATGFDIDLITAIAHTLGLKINVIDLPYNNLLSSLQDKKIDVIVSAYPVSDAFPGKVNFIPYLHPSETLVLPKGNPQKIGFNSLMDLCKIHVSVLVGSLEEEMLQNATRRCLLNSADVSGIQIIEAQDSQEVLENLLNHTAQAAYMDSPTSRYYLKQSPYQQKIEFAKKALPGKNEAMLLRSGNYRLFNALQFAFNLIIQKQIYRNLLNQWGMEEDMLSFSFS